MQCEKYRSWPKFSLSIDGLLVRFWRNLVMACALKNFLSSSLCAGGLVRGLLLLLFLVLGWNPPTLANTICTPSLTNPARSTNPHPPYQLINLGPRFAEFWQQAQDKPFLEQLALWDQLIEMPNQRFYDAMVWNKIDPDWFFTKYERLEAFFGELAHDPTLLKGMIQEFARFEENVAANTARFIKYFSDASFPQVIYAAPAITFNGKANRDLVVGFGIDRIVALNQYDFQRNSNVLYTHEFFHIYHARASQMTRYARAQASNSAEFYLWREGLATYFSQFMNPGTTEVEALGSQELDQISDDGVYWLAAKFLAETSRNQNWHAHWFNYYESSPDGPDLPARCGYLLGLRVAQIIAQFYSGQEMAHWNPLQAQAIVRDALKILANRNKSPKKPANFYRENNR